MGKDTNKNTAERKEKKMISWLDLSEDELMKLTDVSVCMYKKQSQVELADIEG